MKKLSLLLMACMICTGHLVWSQEPGYKWGEPSTNDNIDREIDRLLSYGDDGFILLRKKPGVGGVVDYWIETYDTNLKLDEVNKVEFNLGVMGNSFDIEDIISSNGTIYVFVSHWNKLELANSLSVKTLAVDGTMTDLANLDEVAAKKMMNRGTFEFSISADGSKLLVLSELPFEKKMLEKIRVSCFEVSSMEKLWSTDEELQWPSKRAHNNYVSVDNKGQAYFFKRIWQKPLWNYEMYTFNSSGEFKVHDVLNLSDQEIVDYKLTFNNNNEFIFYATYSSDPSALDDKPIGSIFIAFDSEQKIKTERIAPWSDEVLKEFGGIKDPARNPKANFLSNLGIKDILFKSNGEMLVLMEQSSKGKDGIPGTSPPKYTYTFKYGGFLTLNVNADSGEVNWFQSFKKTQEVKANTSTDPYGSIVYFLKDDRLYILWNNTPLSISAIPPANWTEPDGTKYIKHKAFNPKTKHGTFLHVIEADGSLGFANTKFGLPLFNLHDGAVFEMSMTTPIFFEINGELVIMASMHNGGKRYRFGFVNL